jgi:hypothetical protein
MTGVIISQKLATIRELEEYYSYEDALNMIEVISVNSHNEWLAYEEAKRGK